MFSLSVEPGQSFGASRHPLALVGPITFIHYEKGPFDEIALGALFSRPLSRTIGLAVFSDFHRFNGQAYDHKQGGIYNFYRGMYSDTSRMSNRGYTPYANEQSVGMRVRWAGGDRMRADAEYRYLDLHDEVVARTDTAGLRWDTLAQYGHAASAALAGMRLGPALTDVNLTVARDRQSMASRPARDGMVSLRRAANSTTAGGNVRLSTPVAGKDTLSATYSGSLDRRGVVTGAENLLSAHHAQGLFVHEFSVGPATSDVHASAGHTWHIVNNASGNAWTWNAAAHVRLAAHQWSLYARRDALPYDPPVQPERIVKGTVLDMTQTYGTDLYLCFGKASVFAGYCYSAGVDSSSASHAWPGGVAPYAEPHSVVTLRPSLGNLLGFMLYSRIMWSDVKPFWKIQSGLSWEKAVVGGNERVKLELVLDYWSARDSITYGGVGTWNREILDLYFKTSFQIRTFRIYYKIDNVLNRKIAYVPGYFMPGLTFRWGFNWYFQR